MFKGIYRSKQYHPEDLSTVLKRSLAFGIDKIMITSGSLSDVGDAVKIIDEHTIEGLSMATTIGVHPTRGLDFEKDPELMKKLKNSYDQHSGKIVAVGEFGLDYDRLHFCPKEIQQKWFAAQFDLVEHVKKPLFLHMRNCTDDFVRIIKENRHRFTKGVVHSFTGTPSDVPALLSLDLHIGLNGCSLREQETIEAIKMIPLDRIMVESDAPWCGIKKSHAGYPFVRTHLTATDEKRHSPEAMVKCRNEPIATRQVLEAVAAIHAKPVEEVAHLVYQTTCSIFKL